MDGRGALDIPADLGVNDERVAPHADPLPWRAVLGAMALGTFLVVAVSWWLFPHGSVNVDERVYVQQGIALSDGSLTLPKDFDPDHRPFFTAPNPDGELAFKYTPPWPGVLAASRAVGLGDHGASALAGALLVGGAAAFAHGLTGSARATRATAILAAVAPAAVVLGATRLSYSFATGLAFLAAGILLGAARGRWPLRCVAAGAVGGLAAFARPYDAIVVVGPALLTLFLRSWRTGRAGPPRTRWTAPASIAGYTALGAVLPLGALLWSNARITGNPLQLGYSLVGPHDKLGFGPRIDTPSGTPFDYTPAKAAHTMWRLLQLLAIWLPGSLLGLLLLAVALVCIPAAARRYLLLAGLITTVAYVPVWGAWNGYLRLGISEALGPMYHLPVTVIVVTVLGSGLAAARMTRSRTLLVAAAALVVTAVALLAPVRLLRDQRDDLAGRAALIASASGTGRSLLLLPVASLGFRFETYNDIGLDSRVVYAIDRETRRIPLLRRFHDRSALRLVERYVFAGRPGRASHRDGLGFDRQWVAVPLGMRAAGDFRADVELVGSTGGDYVTVDAGTQHAVAPATAGARLVLHFERDSVRLSDASGAALTPPIVTGPDVGEVCVGRSERSDAVPRDRVCFTVEALGTSSGAVVLPGVGSSAIAPGRYLEADVSDRLRITAPG